MLARIRQSLDENQKGFTLVELLVVVIIIGILAAIAIPVFLGQQSKAQDSAAKSDLANAKIAIASWSVDNTGTPTSAALTAENGYTKSTAASMSLTATGPGAYTLSVVSDSGKTCTATATTPPACASTPSPSPTP